MIIAKILKNITLIISFFLLLLIFYKPFWKIELYNPQYPESLGLNFYIDKIKEIEKNDLSNINILNKYVGIKKIDEKDFKTFFKIIKTCLISIVIFFLFFIIRKKKIFIFILICIYSFLFFIILYYFNIFVDLYINNANKEASLNSIIENFYPPLLFCKQIFNIKICAYPEKSTFIVLFNLLLIIQELFKKENKEKNE